MVIGFGFALKNPFVCEEVCNCHRLWRKRVCVNGVPIVSVTRCRQQPFLYIGAAKSASRRCRLIAAGGSIKISIHKLSLTAPEQWDNVNRHLNPKFLFEFFKALVFVSECSDRVHFHTG